MTKLNIISQNPASTLVAEFVPDQKRERNYQSEAMLEDAFIKQLQEQGYEYLPINDEKALIANLMEHGMKMAPRGALNLSHRDFAELLEYITENF